MFKLIYKLVKHGEKDFRAAVMTCTGSQYRRMHDEFDYNGILKNMAIGQAFCVYASSNGVLKTETL